MRWRTTSGDIASTLTGARRAVIRRRQIEAYLTTVPSAVAGNTFGALLLALLAWPHVSPWPLLGWETVMGAATVARLATAARLRRRIAEPVASSEAERWMVGLTLLLAAVGVWWGIGIAWAMHHVGTESQVVLSLAAAGLASGATSTLSTLPKAAAAFGAPVVIGVAMGLTSNHADFIVEVSMLYALYSSVTYRSLSSHYLLFVTRSLGELDLADRNDTVNLLLHAFEAHSSDWLWEVDLFGRLGPIPERFAQAAARPAAALEGADLVALFDASPERELLARRIAARSPFRDLTLALTIAGEQHWWSLSAQQLRSAEDGGVIGLRGFASDITAAKRAEARISYMAHYDALTDLPNRVLFRETLQRALRRRGEGRLCAVVCLDLDEFKAVNDTLGHPVGDELLKIVAARLGQALHARDMVARQGGDEFSLLITDITGREQVAAICETLIRAVNTPVEVGGHHIITSTSIGIALAPTDGTDDAELVKNADLALYSAKAAGRNCYRFFDPSLDAAARARRNLEMALREALAGNELRIFYQPMINIARGAPAGFEALMRWEHGEYGVIPPDRFISVAEDTGLIVQLGEWVLREATREAARWANDASVSVNLSPVQMRNPGLIASVVGALAHSGLAPQRLVLEITESVLMQDSEGNLATLQRLRELGVGIALDDFGTGYSSLNYLRAFPFDKIKIDRCFVSEVHTNQDNRAIIGAIVSLAHKLGMSTTAEGVELPAQLAELAAIGCDEAQGFHFSRAVPPEQLTDLRRAAPVLPLAPRSTARPATRSAARPRARAPR